MPQSDIKEFSSQQSGIRFQVSGANGKSLSNIQYLKSLNFSILQFLILHSAFPNREPARRGESEGQIHNRKRLHSLPLVVIFPDAFAYSRAVDRQ